MTNPLSLEAFRDFCASKRADEEYDYGDYDNCAVGQYLVSATGGTECDPSFGNVAEDTAFVRPHTFGALTVRLNALIAEQSP